MTIPRVLNTLLIAVLTAALALAAIPGVPFVSTVLAQESEQRTIELQDIMDWKRIGGARLSVDGSWFAYRLAPAEGNGEIIFVDAFANHHWAIGLLISEIIKEIHLVLIANHIVHAGDFRYRRGSHL